VILVHRVKGGSVFLNADLIESIEANPDTVITLADGRRLSVLDPPSELLYRISMFRASVLAAAEDIRNSPGAEVVALPRRKN
jgi:flagellar protein FlbD